MTDIKVPIGAPILCPVCGKNLSGVTKIKLRAHLQLEKATDWQLCPKDQKLFDDGFVAMIEVFNPKTFDSGGKLLEVDAQRTGRIIHLRRALAQDYFQQPIDPQWPLCYVSNVDKNGNDFMKALSLWVVDVNEKARKLSIEQ